MAPGLAALLDCSHAADADAEGEGFGAHIGEVRGAEGGCELLAGEECLDGAGEVLVGAGLVARDECRGEGHDVAAVDVVEPRDGGGAGVGELEDDESARRFQHAAELGEGFGGVVDIAQAERDGDDVEGVIREIQRGGVALLIGDVGAGGVGFGVESLGACDVEHLGCEVEADDGGGAGVGEGAGEVPGAARDIEDGVGWFDGGHADGGASPGLVTPEGVEAVVEIVGGRDGGEHRADLLGFAGVFVGVLREVGVGPCVVGGGG